MTPLYEKTKRENKARSAAAVFAGQDIGAIPPPLDLARRVRADRDFRFFCEDLFPRVFTMAFSPDHLKVIDLIERVVLGHECYAIAMPRGSGKTTICEVAAMWAILIGVHPFAYLIGPTEEAGVALLHNIKAHLSSNDGLLEQYPEAIKPIRELDGESRRCIGQRYYGRKTNIGWSMDQIVMPTIPGSRCSGAIIRVGGITGNIRGAKFVTASGRSVRPSLAIIDDPQTDQSARSPTQVRDRKLVINGAILGLAGPGKRVACLLPCTVIRPEDVADQVLDRQRNPQWHGERTKMVYAFPTNDKLWTEYHRVRHEMQRTRVGGDEANDFYIANREAMDAGAAVGWAERFKPDEVSAIQHAMNLRADIGEEAFAAEYQNEPLPADHSNEPMLTAAEVAEKINGLRLGVSPIKTDHLTAMIDVHDSLLFYCVCAWSDDFTGAIIEYGTYPDQKSSSFTLAKPRRTLAQAHPKSGREGTIIAGLEALACGLLAREWKREDGGVQKIGKLMVDAGYVTDLVYEFCRRSVHAAALLPSKGMGIGAVTRPMDEWPKKPGERMGWHWIIGRARDRASQLCRFDTNHWKSFVHNRMSIALGDAGNLSLWGRKEPSGRGHGLFSEHVTAEAPVLVSAKGRSVNEWRMKPGHVDNHWFDCLVGCAVAASIVGCKLEGVSRGKTKRARVSFAELQQRASAR